MAELEAPSLLAQPTHAAEAGGEAASLLDLLYDGFYMVLLLRNRCAPEAVETFRERVRAFLAAFQRGGKRLEASSEDIYLAKFAYCALVDEVMLGLPAGSGGDWERRPLQLELFGEHLAGERFFDHLERLRERGAERLQLLEVFHMCLLMGFQGKYIVEGSEKVAYVTASVGDEITRHRGRRPKFAPHWAAPDRVSHALRNEVPLWAVGAVFALFGLLAFVGARWQLARQTSVDMTAHRQVVTLAPEPAHVTITLP